MKSYKTIKTILVLCVALAMVSVLPAEAKTIRIDEARIRVELARGESKTGTIRVTNPTEDPTTINIYAEDWKYLDSGNGDKSFFPAGTMEDSASNWITYNPRTMTLPPFGQEELNYTIKAPAETADGTHYSILFFETILGETQDEEGASVLVTGRVGSLVYVDIAGTVNRTGKIESLEFVQGKGNKPSLFNLTFSNTGNTIIALEGEFLLFDSEGLVKGRGKLNPVYTRAGMTVSGSTEWTSRLAPGVYDGVFTFDLGGGDALVEEQQIRIE